MLNIPETVKALFKADGIRKNFRVHFPGGEFSDLTNADIVQESVKYTESLCSQDVLKFGLTEASVIEFETVGAANMYGMTIECGIEIDLSSLTAADLSAIAGGSWDGTYVAAGDSDLGFAYFRVPYGVFRVESCPRDHQAMTHRKVQAYNRVAPLQENPFDAYKLDVAYLPESNETIQIDIMRAAISSIAWNYPQYLSNFTKTEKTSPWSSWPPAESTSAFNIYDRNSDGTYNSKIRATRYRRGSCRPTNLASISNNYQELVSLELDATAKANTAEAVAEIISDLQSLGVPDRAIQTTVNLFTSYFPAHYVANFLDLAGRRVCPIGDGIPVAYFGPYLNNFTQGYFYFFASATLEISTRYKDSQGVTQEVTITKTFDLITNKPKLYNFSDLPDAIIGRYKYTKQEKNNGSTFNMFPDIYDINALVNGYLELYAQYGKISRAGDFTRKRLDNSAPESITPGEYSVLWYDEYDVQPIGGIYYKYNSGKDSDAPKFYEFSVDPSVYDMSDNAAAKAITAPATIETILDNGFIPYAGALSFTPVYLTMKGLPYMEAGDYLAVTTEDGETAYSYVMRLEISGIQALEAIIESASGQIIESEVGT